MTWAGTMEPTTEWPRRSDNCPGPGQNPLEVLTMSDATCSIDGCGKPAQSRGWCSMHYSRWKRHGDPVTGRAPARPVGVCAVDGCDDRVAGHGWCRTHYARWSRLGDPTAEVRARPDWSAGCTVDGCKKPLHAQGWCSMHYSRWQRQGDPLGALPPRGSRPAKVCAVEDCDRAASVRGWCTLHYGRWQRQGDPLVVHAVGGRCSIDDCEGKVKGHGWCGTHYARWRRNGDPLQVTVHDPNIARRFWSKVAAPVTPGGCWLWEAGASRGRGWFTGDQGDLAYRVAYRLMVGEPTDALDHICRIPLCVNPAHLDDVTPAENIRRKYLTAAEHRRIIPAHIAQERAV